MIYDHISKIGTYEGINPKIMKGLQILAQGDFEHQQDGQYQVEGRDLFYSIQSNMTVPPSGVGEAHCAYADIQYALQGGECIGVAPLTEDAVPVKSNPEGDIWHYPVGSDVVTLRPGMFAVLWPQDIHAPGLMIEQSALCRKVVVKVKL